MDAQGLKTAGRGVVLAAGYCGAFLLMWLYSVDQWYLPAGLRLACLLLLPLRQWPYVFVGDAAALLFLRAPKAEQYSAEWAYLSPFLLAATFSLLPLYIRKKLRRQQAIVAWLPLIAFAGCIWSTAVGRILNILLDGPTPTFTLGRFAGFCVGDYLGALMILLPCLLWLERGSWRNSRQNIAQTLAITVLLIVILFGAAMIPLELGAEIRLMPLIFMLLPLTYLTILHGWHGAAIGTVLVNFAISLALPQIPLVGTSDSIVLIAQTTLAAASGALLVIGIKISHLNERSGDSLRAEWLTMQLREQQDRETRTMGAVRGMVEMFERRFREKALLLAYARDDLDAYRHAVAQALKDEGLYRQAMDAQVVGLENARALALHGELLYPLQIETYGLHGVLTSEAFERRWQGYRLRFVLVGRSPTRLSLGVQLAAYRGICSAMEVLAPLSPSEFIIQTRGWRRLGRAGITVFVSCTPVTTVLSIHETGGALQELEMLARAYGGTVKHRHTNRIGFLLSEPIPQVDQYSDNKGRTNQ